MIIGIDASNIRSGGGLTHLIHLLHPLCIEKHDIIEKIVVWGGVNTINAIDNKKGLTLVHAPLLDKPLVFRMIWQQWIFPVELDQKKCDIIFSPGGILPRKLTIPSVLVSQNSLPFENQEAKRFSFFSFMRYKIRLIGSFQRRSMSRANGLIFLSNYANNLVIPKLYRTPEFLAKIPHGIDKRFFTKPKVIKKLPNHKFSILYVSTIDVYKHQWNVAQAIYNLRERGFSVELNFVGQAYKPSGKKLEKLISKLDPNGKFIHYLGAVPFKELHHIYSASDIFVFASSCENLPNILLEAMASGLPIASSNRGPMPEVLKECGLYFDPERVSQIENRVFKLITTPTLSKRLSFCSHEEAKKYNWSKTSDSTFSFISKVYMELGKK